MEDAGADQQAHVVVAAEDPNFCYGIPYHTNIPPNNGRWGGDGSIGRPPRLVADETYVNIETAQALTHVSAT